jgi:hypothetical protein
MAVGKADESLVQTQVHNMIRVGLRLTSVI